MKRAIAFLCLAAAMIAALATPPSASAQFVQNASSQYGATPWAVNNQRVASQFNYVVDSLSAVGSPSSFTFPAQVCTSALPNVRNASANAFPAGVGATVKIFDATSANNETLSLATVPVTFAGGNCTINLVSASFTHLSYRLRSGTCGLREALADLGGAGGTVFVTQEFYDQGCSASTITGLSLTSGAGLQANQYIVDISNGQNTPFILKGTSLSLTAAPTALTTAGGTAATLQTATTGGSITNGAAIRAGITCVDAIGRETALSTDSAGTAVVTTGAGSTNTITVTAPGATGCPNSVGYRTYLTAAGGGTLTEILYAPSSSATVGNQCVASANSVIVSACALTSNSVVVSIITGTAGIPKTGVVSGGSGATAVGYLPARAMPPVPGFQMVYGPFPAITTVTTVQPAAEVVIPAGFFGTLGQATQICLAGVGTPAAATVAGSFALTLGPRQATGVQTIDNVPFTASSTWNPAAASNWTYCTIAVVAATGASGTIEAHTLTGFSTSATAGAVPPAFGPQLDTTTAASSAIDLTQQAYLDVLLTASASSFTTFTVRQISFTPLN